MVGNLRRGLLVGPAELTHLDCVDSVASCPRSAEGGRGESTAEDSVGAARGIVSDALVGADARADLVDHILSTARNTARDTFAGQFLECRDGTLRADLADSGAGGEE